MGMWILSFCIMAIEAWGAYISLIPFGRKRMGRLESADMLFCIFSMVVALLGGYFDLMGIKGHAEVFVSMAFCAVFLQKRTGNSASSFPD